jgi:hypothetical protein
VTLTADERKSLHGLIAAGKAAATQLTHARRPLKAEAAPAGPGWTAARIADAVEGDVTTAERVRRRFVEQGFEAALVRTPHAQPSRERELDGKGEARLIPLARSKPRLFRGKVRNAGFSGLSGLAVGSYVASDGVARGTAPPLDSLAQGRPWLRSPSTSISRTA